MEIGAEGIGKYWQKTMRGVAHTLSVEGTLAGTCHNFISKFDKLLLTDTFSRELTAALALDGLSWLRAPK